MYNPQKVLDLLESTGAKNRELLDFMGKNWNGSVAQVISGDIRVSKLEKIADFFGVSVEEFFDRDPANFGVNVGGRKNNVHHFSVNNDKAALEAMNKLIEEKDKRIALMEAIIGAYKSRFGEL